MGSFGAKQLLSVVSPAGKQAKLSILIFHRIISEVDPLFPGQIETCAEFDSIMRWVKEWFTVLPLHQAAKKMTNANLPARAACITFDDGYADNYTNALPILERHGLHATFFIATGFLDGGRMWNDTMIEAIRSTSLDVIDCTSIGLGVIKTASLAEKRAAIEIVIPALKHRYPAERADTVSAFAELAKGALPTDLMLSSSQLKGLHSSGMGIGAHTVSHPILARSSEHEVRSEIAQSRENLEGLIGERVGLFAYPNGKYESDYSDEHVSMVKDLGFDAAVSTNAGVSRHGDDLYQLRRFSPWDRSKRKYWLRMMANIVLTK